MGSRSNSGDYTQQGGPEIPRYMRPHQSEKVATNYYAELTPEEFREVQSTLRNLDGNPQVEPHPSREKVYVVKVDRESLNTSLQDQVLQAFQSQDGTAYKTYSP